MISTPSPIYYRTLHQNYIQFSKRAGMPQQVIQIKEIFADSIQPKDAFNQ